MIYDVIIIWAGAAWLFAWINLDKNLNKLILEKNDKPWIKVLLSWGERANVSNIDIDVERDYFWQNKKALISIFKRFNQWDIQSFFAENWVNIVEEDRWRLILESWDSSELLDLLVKKLKENNCELKINSDVKKIKPHPNPLLWEEREQWKLFDIICDDWKIHKAKNIIVSSGWKSFFQVWTTGEWYNFAKDLWIKIISPHKALCGLTAKKDFKELSGSSMNLWLKLVDNKKIIYEEFWPLLFTHFWISWPIVFNTANVLWEYLNGIWIFSEEEKIKYILNNIKVELNIDKEKATKKIVKFFEKELENDEKIEFWLQDWRSWKEAKATWWWININELDKNMQSKKYCWLYFIWEVVDVTWKTWWFNLQWAWSSAYVCWKSIK